MDRNKKGQFVEGNKSAETWTEEKAMALGEELIEWMRKSEMNFSFEEFFVLEKDMYPNVYSYLIGKFEPFSKLIEKAKKIQEIRVSKGCLLNEYNGGFGKFFLGANHNWSEKQEIEIESTENKVIEVKVLETNFVEPQPKKE